MSEEQGKEDAIQILEDKPMILDKVDYMYVSYAQVGINSMDFRIAFGDHIPPEGKVKPSFGVIMSHSHARALLEVLSVNVPKIDALMKRVEESKKASLESSAQPPK